MSERKDAIVRVAAGVFARNGYHGTTVREIADEAGILSGSLYHHFDSKETLAGKVLRPYFTYLVQQFRDAMERIEDPAALFAELIRITCRGIAEFPEEVAFVQNSSAYLMELESFSEQAAQIHEMREAWISVIDRGITAGIWSPEVDAHIIERTVSSVHFGTVQWWRPGGRYTIDQVADKYIDLFLSGMAGPRVAPVLSATDPSRAS